MATADDGALITKDHQYQFNGLLIGSGTSYFVESWDGLFDITSIVSNDLTPQDRDGVIPGSDLLGARTITGVLDLLESSQTALYDDLEAFQTAFRSLRSQELPFVYKLPGRDLRYINCRPRKSALPKDADLAYGRGAISLQLAASDPRHYSLSQSSQTLAVADGATSGQITINNGGNYFTECIITLNGLATNPIITMASQTPIDDELDTTGNAIRLQYTNGSADATVIDTRRGFKTITYNGADSYNIRRTDSQWFVLMPGDNVITLQRDAGAVGSACSATFVWNEAWNY